MGMNKAALKAVAKLSHIDLVAAIRTTRHNPILDSEIHIEEELINLQESLDSYYAAGDTLQKYPKIYKHVVQEKQVIMQHCIGLVVRMMHGKQLPRTYSKQDIDYAIKRLVQMVVEETYRTGRRIDADVLDIFKPFLTVRQRVAIREWGMDLLMQASQLPKMYDAAQRLPQTIPTVLRSRV